MIRVRGVRKAYGSVVALDGVDLEVAAGRVLGVVGPSGAGKSTLVRCLTLLERPDAGSVEVDGQDLASLPAAQLRSARRRIGMVFQSFALLDSRTAAGNVAMPLELAGVARPEREARVRELLELVGLGDKAGAHPAQLSGGQQQRVGIARALAARPSVLLCDEATSALDPETTRSVLALLRRLTRELGLTVVLITHEMGVVKEVCDDVALLAGGRVVEAGPVGEVATRPGSALGAALLPPLPDVAPALGAVQLDLVFGPGSADRPVLAGLVQAVGPAVNVVGGAVEDVGGARIGRMRLEVPADLLDDALAHLAAQDLRPAVRRAGAGAEVAA